MAALAQIPHWLSDSGWSLGWGDRTLSGYVLTAGYLLANLLCFALLISGRLPRERQRFWRFATLVYVAIGLNKQADLQTPLALIGRELSLEEGWFAERRLVGGMFAAACLIGALLLAPRFLRTFRRAARPERYALASLGVLGFFVLLRIANFRHVDPLPESTWDVLHIHRLLELVSIMLMIAAVALRFVAPD